MATASDYRRCSERTIGKWTKRAHRLFHWRQLRFEVKFSTPRISCAPPSSDFEPKPSPIFDLTLENVPISNSKYDFVPAKPRKAGCRLRANSYPSDKEWFLEGKSADAEAKCSWLMLLEDTTCTDLKFTIREIRNSYDFIPASITKPLASAEKKSFLTLMSLFGVQWENRGKGAVLAGAGQFCEITAQNTTSFREIYVYTSRKNVDDSTGYYLFSERARKAMFHCFDLGFATFLTHSDAEIKNSMEKSSPALDTAVIDTVADFYRGSNQWCPGLSESITCWATQSMPKVVEKKQDKQDTFKSMFSAISAISMTTGKPSFVRMLLGNDTDNRCQIPDIKTLTGWAREYLCEVGRPNVKALLLESLRYAAESDVYQNISDREISWKVSCDCLKAVRILDLDLDNRLLKILTDDQKRNIKKSISNQQINYGSRLYVEALAEAENEGTGSWIQELDIVGARNYIEVAKHIKEEFNNDPEFVQTVSVGIRKKFGQIGQMIVVNRLMRGALWVIHNGNAPNQAERLLECSLSSSWLSDTSTVWIT